MRNPYGPNEGNYRSVVDLATPEGYPVYYDATLDAVFVEVAASLWERFDKNTDAPGDYSDSERFDPDFLKNHQETYDGRD